MVESGGSGVINRTIRQALEHAEEQKQYAMPEAANLVSDFILLADELRRLRAYDCGHPPMCLHQIAYVSEKGAEKVWKDLGMQFGGTPVETHPSVTDYRIHLPQPDGTCHVINY